MQNGRSTLCGVDGCSTSCQPLEAAYSGIPNLDINF